MVYRRICNLLVLCAIAVSALAVPARRDGMVRIAADGTEKMVFLHGNETFHYMTDAEGNWLDEETLAPLSEEVKGERLKAKGERLARRVQQQKNVNRLLTPRGAIILVSFQDKTFQESNEEMTQWAMGETYTYNGATGSVRQYFHDQSWGQYQMEIDVYGPVTVSQDVAYYGKNNSQGDDQHADEMVKEACILAHDSCGADFSKYDADGDGKVDWVVILYAGKGEADGGAATTVWPHQYELSYTDMSFKLDGKRVDHYCCLNEVDGQTGKRCGIGTFCHEFSHVMGLPDFYCTNNASHRNLGSWDIMDYGPYNNGGNTPPAYSAYERWFMGWIQPTLLNEASDVAMEDINRNGAAAYITDNGSPITNILNPDPSVFYMLENRQKSGWDKYLSGHGLMVTKVQFNASKWDNNEVNNNSRSLGVDMIEAKANTSAYYDKPTDLYPAGATEFTSSAQYQVTNITEQSQRIFFQVNGGGKNVELGIENVSNVEMRTQKRMENGRVVIIRDGQKFDILGNRL